MTFIEVLHLVGIMFEGAAIAGAVLLVFALLRSMSIADRKAETHNLEKDSKPEYGTPKLTSLYDPYNFGCRVDPKAKISQEQHDKWDREFRERQELALDPRRR